jgi:hypothetical protein
MSVRRRGLGVVSEQARALIEASGGRVVQKAPSATWAGVFAQPIEFEAVMPDGTRLSADMISRDLSLADPGAAGSIIPTMMITRLYETGHPFPEAVTNVQELYPPAHAMAYTGIYAGAAPVTTPAAPSTTYYPRVSVSNLTRPGQDFQPGDEWLVQIGAARPNSPVSCTARRNGTTSTSPYGQTDAAGFFQLRGRMSDAEIGSWEETWRAGPEEASPRVTFKVVAKAGAAAPPVTTYYPRVSVSNLSRPGQDFQPGDEWLVSIGGARPNASVSCTARRNGTTSTSEYGRTDAGGFFQLRGSMSQTEIGSWEETWRAGPEEASPRVTFKVVAKPGAAAPPPGEEKKKEEAPQEQPPPTSALLDQLKAVPWWVWAAAGGGILLARSV